MSRHGTHCAGIAGGNNVGVARGANIYGLKVLSDYGSGSTETIIAGMNKVLEDRIDDPSRRMVVSMSLGGYCGSYCSTDAMIEAVEILSENNITVVVAAGNSADDACQYTPAAAPSAVTVGATDRIDEWAYYSSFGSCVDILAPGSDVSSACASLSMTSCANGNQYVEMSGTSMACPHVSGVTALWLAQSESAPPPSTGDVKVALQCSSAKNKIDDVPGGSLNLLLQVPDAGVPISGARCGFDEGCNTTNSLSGEVCSGHGACMFGSCICDVDYVGDDCGEYLPYWIHYSWCCNGQDLSDSVNPPFNSISFMWTDLNPSAGGNIYHGLVGSGEAYAFVFENVPSYVSHDCRVSVEVILHKQGSFELIYSENDIGVESSCYGRMVSVGVKGPAHDALQYMYIQAYGPSYTGMLSSGNISFVTSSAPTTSPTTSSPTISYAPTAIPTHVPSSRPTSTYYPTHDRSPTSHPSSRSPTLAPSFDGGSGYWVDSSPFSDSYFDNYDALSILYLSDDSSTTIDLPFLFQFYDATFSSIELCSNGLIGFKGSHNIPSGSGCSTVGYRLDDTFSGGYFDILAFFWTDLNPYAGGVIYYGFVAPSSFAVVFSNVVMYGNSACATSIEVILHQGGNIEIIYVENDIGYQSGCMNGNSISIGIKGPYTNNIYVPHVQLYGPSPSGMFESVHIYLYLNATVLTPVLPSTLPTSISPSLSPSGQRDSSYTVEINAFSGSYFENYNTLNVLPLSDDDSDTLHLPFSFRFYDEYFNSIELCTMGSLDSRELMTCPPVVVAARLGCL